MKALTIKVKNTDIKMTREFATDMSIVYAIENFVFDLLKIGVEYPDIEIAINPIEEENDAAHQ